MSEQLFYCQDCDPQKTRELKKMKCPICGKKTTPIIVSSSLSIMELTKAASSSSQPDRKRINRNNTTRPSRMKVTTVTSQESVALSLDVPPEETVFPDKPKESVSREELPDNTDNKNVTESTRNDSEQKENHIEDMVQQVKKTELPQQKTINTTVSEEIIKQIPSNAKPKKDETNTNEEIEVIPVIGTNVTPVIKPKPQEAKKTQTSDVEKPVLKETSIPRVKIKEDDEGNKKYVINIAHKKKDKNQQEEKRIDVGIDFNKDAFYSDPIIFEEMDDINFKELLLKASLIIFGIIGIAVFLVFYF